MTRQLQLGLRDELIVDNFAGGMRNLPPAGPGSTEQTVEMDCGVWGCWAITYRPHRDPRWRNWFWVAALAEETGAGLP